MLWRCSPAATRRPEGFIEPCLPTLGHNVPSGPQWVHEIKYDGYRSGRWPDWVKVKNPRRAAIQVSNRSGEAREVIRRLKNVSELYPTVYSLSRVSIGYNFG